MDDAQAASFIAQAHAGDALRLRVWDDLAKQLDWQPTNSQDALDELASRIQQHLGARA